MASDKIAQWDSIPLFYDLGIRIAGLLSSLYPFFTNKKGKVSLKIDTSDWKGFGAGYFWSLVPSNVPDDNTKKEREFIQYGSSIKGAVFISREKLVNAAKVFSVYISNKLDANTLIYNYYGALQRPKTLSDRPIVPKIPLSEVIEDEQLLLNLYEKIMILFMFVILDWRKDEQGIPSGYIPGSNICIMKRFINFPLKPKMRPLICATKNEIDKKGDSSIMYLTRNGVAKTDLAIIYAPHKEIYKRTYDEHIYHIEDSLKTDYIKYIQKETDE